MATMLRQGLPRTRDGQPWPPSDVAIAFDVPAPAGVAPLSAAAATADATATSRADVAPVAAASLAAVAVLRRGLPRAPGAEPWPPADIALPAVAPPAASASVPSESAPAASAPVASVPAAPAPAAHAGEAEESPRIRRGLPRAIDGEPWPPAGAIVDFAVPSPSARTAAAPSAVAPRATEPQASEQQAPEPQVAPSLAPARRMPAPRTSAPKPAVAARRPSAPASEPEKRSAGKLGQLVEAVGGGMVLVIGAVIAIVVASAAVLLVRMWLWGTTAGTDFVAAYPGEVHLPEWAPTGFPGWMMWTHWLNAFFMVLIIKTGWTIRTTSRPTAMWQSRRGGKKIAVEQWIHLSLDVLWLINGAVFVVLLFATGQWIRVVPFSWEFIPNAVSSALQYVSLSWPTENGWTNYNALQVFAYFITIFVAAPLAALTGVRMSPAWPAKAERLSKIYPIEVARKIHFPVMLYFVLFIAAHVFLVFATGALRNLNHMFWGTDDEGSWAGFTMFGIGMLAIIGAVAALRPLVVQQLSSLFGKVGR